MKSLAIFSTIFISLIMTACGGDDKKSSPPTDNSSTEIWYVDADSDGFGDKNRPADTKDSAHDLVANHTDCDDNNSEIHPDATEVLDGLDNDCDSLIDEELKWYQDRDNDSFGDPETEVTGAQPSSEWVSDNTDCDDTSALIFPAATEVLDNIDNNCNGEIDENFTLLNFGNTEAFSTSSTHWANYWLGSLIYIDQEFTMTQFGVIAKKTGGNMRMGLWDNTGLNNGPGELIAVSQTTPISIKDAPLLLDVNETIIPAGDYYLMAIYDQDSSVAQDSNNTTSVFYVAHNFADADPSSFPEPSTYKGKKNTYYIKGFIEN